MKNSKRILTVSDLYSFYEKKNEDVKFSSNENGSSIVVHIDEPFRFEATESDDLIMQAYLRLCHTERNRNGSFVSDDAMEDAMPSAYNMPILGYIWHDDEADEYKFAGHEFYMNEDGGIEYEEVPIGCIPESADLHLVYDEDKGKKYLEGTGIIWKTYSHAAEILEKQQELSVSVELSVEELSYNASEKVLSLDKFKFSGVTILQADPYTGDEIEPGMEGANISIKDFSTENNSLFTNRELLMELKKFNENFQSMNINQKNERKEDDAKVNTDNDIIMENTAEDVVEDVQDADVIDVEMESETVEPDEAVDVETSDADETEDFEVEETVEDDVKDETYSLTLPNGTVKNFSLSLNDMENALYNLINDTFSEQDNAWYSVTVYPDDSKVVMYDWWTGAAYRMSYERNENNFALVGERVSVHSIWVTDEEDKKLSEMQSNYSSITEQLETYQASEEEGKKVEILNDEAYMSIAEDEEFVKLVEDHVEFSVDELRAKCDSLLRANVKESMKKENGAFSAKPKAMGMRMYPLPMNTKTAKNKSRYGNLFKK